MANIRQYNSPVDSVRPTETGIDATVQTARHVAAQYDQTGRELGRSIGTVGSELADYDARREISRGAAGFSNLFALATDSWNKQAKNADPNDTTLKERFINDELNPALSNYVGTFTNSKARDWAENKAETLRQHMTVKTAADMSTLAGEAAVVNMQQTTNALSATVRNDPTAVKTALDMANAAVEDIVRSSPNLDPATAGKVRAQLQQQVGEQIIKAHFLGKAEINPDAALKELDSINADHPWAKYVNSQEISQIIRYADQQAKLAKAFDRQTQAFAKQQAKDEADAFGVKTYLDSIDEKTGMPMASPDFFRKLKENALNLQHATPGLMRELFNYGMSLDKKPGAPLIMDAAVFRGLQNRLLDQNNPLTVEDILRARNDAANGRPGINDAAAASLTHDLNSLNTEGGRPLMKARTEFFKRFAPAIDGYLSQSGTASGLGSQRIFEAEQDAKRAEEELRKQGKNPLSLYDASSPDFFGRPANLQKYRVSFQDALEYSQNVSGAGKPVKIPAGWSAEEVKKRYAPGTKIILPDGTPGVVPQ